MHTEVGALEGLQKKIITKWNREKAAANFVLDHGIFGQNCDMCPNPKGWVLAHTRV